EPAAAHQPSLRPSHAAGRSRGGAQVAASRLPRPGKHRLAPGTRSGGLLMARPIRLDLPARDPRAELPAPLRDPPSEQAEALLALLEVAQGLHDRGVLDLLRGALDSGDRLTEIAVDVVRTPEATHVLRNLVLLANALAAIDPDVLADGTRTVPDALARSGAADTQPPGALTLLGRFRDEDVRRGLAAATGLLAAVGRVLSRKDRS